MLHTYTHNECPHQVSTSYTLWMPRYNPEKILKLISLWQDYRSNQGHTMTSTPRLPNKCTYKTSTFYTLWIPRYSPHKILKVKVTTARSNVKSKPHHDDTHLQPQSMPHTLTAPNNVPTRYQLPTHYGC